MALTPTTRLLLALTLVGCSACREPDVNINVRVDSSATSTGPSAGSPSRTPPPPTPDTASAPDLDPAPGAGMVSEQGHGTVRIGMTRAQAERALGPVEQYPVLEGDQCRYLNPTGAPDGVAFMTFDDVVARVDVSPFDGRKTVPAAQLPRTAAGVGVGSTQAEVEAAYAGRVRTQPHEYTDGRYLIVTPAADTARRIVFETDAAGKVTEFRAGRRPEVEWIEGCS